MDSILLSFSKSFSGAIAMTVVFNSLPEAQAYATTNGIAKYWRVHFTDADTREKRAREGWEMSNSPKERIYMDLADAIDCIAQRAAGTQDRTEIETLWTEDVSNSLMAQ